MNKRKPTQADADALRRKAITDFETGRIYRAIMRGAMMHRAAAKAARRKP